MRIVLLGMSVGECRGVDCATSWAQHAAADLGQRNMQIHQLWSKLESQLAETPTQHHSITGSKATCHINWHYNKYEININFN